MSHTLNLDAQFTTEKATTKKGGLKMAIVRFKAKRKAKKIMRSLNEAKKTHAGKNKAKTLDQFLTEL